MSEDNELYSCVALTNTDLEADDYRRKKERFRVNCSFSSCRRSALTFFLFFPGKKFKKKKKEHLTSCESRNRYSSVPRNSMLSIYLNYPPISQRINRKCRAFIVGNFHLHLWVRGNFLFSLLFLKGLSQEIVLTKCIRCEIPSSAAF